MSKGTEKSFFEKLATVIVDKRNLIFFLYACALIFCLFSRNWVSVCNDITEYLPETTETRQGLTLMEEEFTTFGTARVMVSHVTYEIAEELAEQMEHDPPARRGLGAVVIQDNLQLPHWYGKTLRLARMAFPCLHASRLHFGKVHFPDLPEQRGGRAHHMHDRAAVRGNDGQIQQFHVVNNGFHRNSTAAPTRRPCGSNPESAIA